MNRRLGILVSLLVLVLASAPVLADDVTGESEMLCTPANATLCLDDGECFTKPPWEWNIPQFIVVDLEQSELRTTQASGDFRTTPIKNMVRDDGQIHLQGVEAQRAFSFVIDEPTGMATFVVAMNGLSVTAFGVCTPATDHE